MLFAEIHFVKAFYIGLFVAATQNVSMKKRTVKF